MQKAANSAGLAEAEYFQLAEESLEKLEYTQGLIFALGGGTPAHSQLAMNMGTALTNRLRGGGCRAYTSDLRIYIPDADAFTYPDVSVVCGALELHPRRSDTVTNPSVIVEVLSPSTELYDRDGKWRLYQRTASLREYVLVSSGYAAVEHFQRAAGGGWLYRSHVGRDAVLVLGTPSLSLPLSELYADLDIPDLTSEMLRAEAPRAEAPRDERRQGE